LEKIDFYIIATPIGNYKDISLRSLETLKTVDFIVCEEEREYKKLSGILGCGLKKFVVCNEHNESEAVEISLELLKKGEVGALVSDCGTPLFEDPGFQLLNALRNNNYRLTSLPGANSMLTALPLCPFRIKDFYFAGFLPKKKEDREKHLINLLKRAEPIILMEAPYRLKNILELLKLHLKNRKIFIPFNLTMEDEQLFYGSVIEVENKLNKMNIEKGEYLIFIERKNG